MRVKTDERRKNIIDVAWEVFKAQGFERASMAVISERVGGSKATLYSYFKSKDELFAAAMEEAVKDRLGDAFEQVSKHGDLAARLLSFARTYMKMRLAPEMIAADRALIGQADQSELPLVLLRQFVAPEWGKLAAVLASEMDAGHLRPAPHYVAAMHFRGLVESDLLERRLHGDDNITRGEIDTAITEGVDAFLRAYSAVS